jgi:hypothetical protein
VVMAAPCLAGLAVSLGKARGSVQGVHALATGVIFAA